VAAASVPSDWKKLEETCDFSGAAREALRAGEPRQAARLAALAGDTGTLSEAVDALTDHGTDDEMLIAAEDLLSRGFGSPAGELFEAARKPERAGEAFAAGGNAIKASEAFERAGKPAEGARALERAIRDDAGNEAVRLALAKLLVRHGRTENAVKVIQAMRVGSPERRMALPLLSRSLRGLNLSEAALEVEREMEKLGIPVGDAVEAGSVPDHGAAGEVVFGRYEVVAEIAKTPNARVVEAIDRITSDHVAVKFVNAAGMGTGRDALSRFEREARALGRLHHTNIVALRGYFADGPAMILEWMSGGSLADMLTRETLAPARAAEIACAVLSALGEAHRLGILHRDVKPANVLFDGIGSPRLADFGAAHLSDASATATAAAIGTLVYMSPEQRLGRPATVASDLYAVGALLYEMLTGDVALPLHGGSFDAPLSEGAHRIERPSVVHDDLTPAHDAIVARLLAEDPDARPHDAFEARKLVESEKWSSRVLERSAAPSVRPRASVPPEASTRLGPARTFGDGRDVDKLRFDAWFERHVIVLPLDDATLKLARVVASEGHSLLPTILRVSTTDKEIWVAPPLGKAVADGADLTAAMLDRLGAAVSALHRRGAGHGSIDAEHVYVLDGEASLAFPRKPAALDATLADDRGLAELRTRVVTRDVR
jgi:serine/threonine-protein kinase